VFGKLYRDEGATKESVADASRSIPCYGSHVRQRHESGFKLSMEIMTDRRERAAALPARQGAADGTNMAELVEQTHGRTGNVAGPMYLTLFPIPVVCFVAALVTDIVYASSAFLMWLHFSQWLIAAGLVFGALAALVLLVDFVANPVIRRGTFGWAHLGLFYAALIVELFNAFVHTIDGWTAVVPSGMILSIIGAILALAAVWTLFMIPVAWIALKRTRS